MKNGEADEVKRVHHINGHVLESYGFNEHLEGPPYILLHGIASSHYFWREGTLPKIRDERRWYALTLPGHAPAKFADGFTTEQLTPSLLVELAYGAIRELVGDAPFVLVGHSTGGFLSLALAARHTQQVAGVISVAGFARGRWGGPLRPMQILARSGRAGQMLVKAQLRAITLSPSIYRLATSLYAADARAMHQNPYTTATYAYLYPWARALNGDDVLHYFIKMPEIDITPWIPAIQAPTLVITGEADAIVPPYEAEHIAAHIKDSELVKIAGAGHMVMAERMDAYNAALAHWIERQGL